MKIDGKSKLTSRKFWAAIADFVGMLLIALHVAENTVTQVTALILSGAGVVAYILAEGFIDTAREKGEVIIATAPEEQSVTENDREK